MRRFHDRDLADALGNARLRVQESESMRQAEMWPNARSCDTRPLPGVRAFLRLAGRKR